MSRFKDFPREPKIFKPERHSKSLNRSLCVPSLVDSYSICIAYMKDWILQRLKPYEFKTVWVDGKHIYDDYRNFSRKELLKRPLPSLTIVPSIDWAFNNENIDSYPYGLSLYTTSGRFKDSFFKDAGTDTYMGIGLETILMPFTFRFRVESRAQQIDMYNHIKKACRYGFSDGRDVDLDFNVPYDLMLQLADDLGFGIDDTSETTKPRVKYISKFLNYLNMHSQLPFIYKHRNINGNNEFYLRMNNMYVHIKPTDLSVDDGEREGHLSNNYNIELQCEVRFPAPKFYAYYSNNEHKLHKLYSVKNGVGDINVRTFYQFKTTDLPDINDKGWNLFLTTSYEDEEACDNNKPLVIDFKELFEGDIAKAIFECIDSAMSPAIFLDLKLINDATILEYKMDWENQILTTKAPIHNPMTYIGLYCDLDFMHDMLESRKESERNRVTIAKDPVNRAGTGDRSDKNPHITKCN